MPQNGTQQGKVKWFNESKGYGFIELDDASGKDLFVHVSDVQGGVLKEGDAVEFEVGDGKKGPCAKNVKVI